MMPRHKIDKKFPWHGPGSIQLNSATANSGDALPTPPSDISRKQRRFTQRRYLWQIPLTDRRHLRREFPSPKRLMALFESKSRSNARRKLKLRRKSGSSSPVLTKASNGDQQAYPLVESVQTRKRTRTSSCHKESPVQPPNGNPGSVGVIDISSGIDSDCEIQKILPCAKRQRKAADPKASNRVQRTPPTDVRSSSYPTTPSSSRRLGQQCMQSKIPGSQRPRPKIVEHGTATRPETPTTKHIKGLNPSQSPWRGPEADIVSTDEGDEDCRIEKVALFPRRHRKGHITESSSTAGALPGTSPASVLFLDPNDSDCQIVKTTPSPGKKKAQHSGPVPQLDLGFHACKMRPFRRPKVVCGRRPPQSVLPGQRGGYKTSRTKTENNPVSATDMSDVSLSSHSESEDLTAEGEEELVNSLYVRRDGSTNPMLTIKAEWNRKSFITNKHQVLESRASFGLDDEETSPEPSTSTRNPWDVLRAISCDEEEMASTSSLSIELVPDASASSNDNSSFGLKSLKCQYSPPVRLDSRYECRLDPLCRFSSPTLVGSVSGAETRSLSSNGETACRGCQYLNKPRSVKGLKCMKARLSKNQSALLRDPQPLHSVDNFQKPTQIIQAHGIEFCRPKKSCRQNHVLHIRFEHGLQEDFGCHSPVLGSEPPVCGIDRLTLGTHEDKQCRTALLPHGDAANTETVQRARQAVPRIVHPAGHTPAQNYKADAKTQGKVAVADDLALSCDASTLFRQIQPQLAKDGVSEHAFKPTLTRVIKRIAGGEAFPGVGSSGNDAPFTAPNTLEPWTPRATVAMTAELRRRGIMTDGQYGNFWHNLMLGYSGLAGSPLPLLTMMKRAFDEFQDECVEKQREVRGRAEVAMKEVRKQSSEKEAAQGLEALMQYGQGDTDEESASSSSDGEGLTEG